MKKVPTKFRIILKRFSAYCLIAMIIFSTIIIAPATKVEAETTVTASSGSASAIQSAINTVSAKGGGTVRIPAGTFNLGGSVSVGANIKLIGAGMDATILRTSGTSQIIRVQGNNARLSGFTLISTNYDGGNGIMVGNVVDFRIDHCRIEGYSSLAAIHVRGGDARGVIDHNYIKNKPATSNNYGVVVYGDDIFTEDLQLGTQYAVFIEDNTFINTRHAVASNADAHYVFRYNLVQKNVADHPVDAHGPYWGGNTGTRAFEIYNNVIENPQTSPTRAICPRGGGGVIFNNTIRGYDYAVMFRIEDGYTTSTYPLYRQPHDVYIWDNSYDGRYNVGYANQNNTSTFVKENRDWFAYALPGYRPYQYPHPLVTGDTPAPVNNPPTAANDAYTLDQDTTLTKAAPGLLANDSDPNNDALTAVIVTNPTQGVMVLNTNGSFTYTPNSGFSGTDSFTYQASDGKANSETATVTLSIKPVVTPPPTTPPPPATTTTTPPPPSQQYSFGLDAGTHTYNQLPNVINAMRYQNDGDTGMLSELRILFDDSTPHGKVRLAVYADDDGKPGVLLLDAGEASVANGWVVINGLNLPVVKGAYYWLAFNLSDANGVKYQANQPAGSHNRVSYSYGAFPSQYPNGGLLNANRYILSARIISF